ncbi:uncharacterized protein BDR25DRAFT_351653 [Lindgomyces ingoldianus]|uniref:Uncharacterized protein n=1 Tax=Lindgomyces ingoldianus TaxID=673940 RepID=A0ACB6R711_9PLEO|nr:uncharacterized protein BDR25DRAFT_351653 [Lindgomyces ingoldianus]KAF2474110.1 hypothetical protein BDR25DRAFT_351653 [Lindgomyces ingoldianus]
MKEGRCPFDYVIQNRNLFVAQMVPFLAGPSAQLRLWPFHPKLSFTRCPLRKISPELSFQNLLLKFSHFNLQSHHIRHYPLLKQQRSRLGRLPSRNHHQFAIPIKKQNAKNETFQQSCRGKATEQMIAEMQRKYHPVMSIVSNAHDSYTRIKRVVVVVRTVGYVVKIM